MLMTELLRRTYRKERIDNFNELKQRAGEELRMEMERRIENMDNIPKIDRRHDPKNYQFVKFITQRDGQRCFSCGKTDLNCKYEVSHILPVGLFPEFAYEEWNAQMECRECNIEAGNHAYRLISKRIKWVREVNEKLKLWLLS